MRKVLVVLVVLALAGCGSADGDGGLTLEDPPSTSSVQPVETTQPEEELDPEAAVKAEIVAAYRRSFEDFVAVASDPNGQLDDPRLSKNVRGTALAAVQLGIRKLRADGHVLQVTQTEMNPTVVELGPEAAVVEDCGIDVSGVVDQDTGEIIEPAGPPELELAIATYELVDGVWMQNSFEDTEGPCVPAES